MIQAVAPCRVGLQIHENARFPDVFRRSKGGLINGGMISIPDQPILVTPIPFERQKTILVVYKGRVVGKHRLDLVIDNKIILELKAVSALNDVFKQQLLSYLKATGLRLGILINFGGKRVEAVRIVN